MAKKSKAAKEYVTVVSPVGIISYPYLVKPDTGRKESSNKYSIELFIPKPVWAKEGKPIMEGVLKVAREYFNDPKLKLADIAVPFKDMDTVKDADDWQKGHIRLRAKAAAERKPTVIGARKDPNTDKFPVLTDEEVAAIKGGDHARIICGVFGYSQQGGGVALGLNFVQFAKEGKALGQGKMKQIEALDEIEVEIDDVDSMVDTDDSDDEDSALSFG